MTFEDDVRKYVIENYLIPAQKGGLSEIIVRVGDIHDEMGLSSKLNEVCMVLKKDIQINRPIAIMLIYKPAGDDIQNVFIKYKLGPKPLNNEIQSGLSPQETSEQGKISISNEHKPPVIIKPEDPKKIQDELVKELVGILRQIPYETWNSIISQENEYNVMRPIFNKYGFNRFSVLMIMLELNNYEPIESIKGDYWYDIRDILDGSQVPEQTADIYFMLNNYYKTREFHDEKLKRMSTFLDNDLAKELWKLPPDIVADDFNNIWMALSELMARNNNDELIINSMNSLAISLLLSYEPGFDTSHFSFLTNLATVRFARQLGFSSTPQHQINNFWNEILINLQKTNYRINIIHLNSLICQLDEFDNDQIVRYFAQLGFKSIGEEIVSLIQ